MKKLFFAGVVGLLAAGFSGCQHEAYDPQRPDSTVESAITKARRHLENEVGRPALPDIYHRGGVDVSRTRSPEAPLALTGAIEVDWDGAWMWENDSFSVTEARVRLVRPVRYATLIRNDADTVSYTVQAPVSRVVVVSEAAKPDSLHSFLVTWLPDEGWEGDAEMLSINPVGRGYNGVVLYSRADGTPMWGWRHDDDEIANTLLFEESSEEDPDPHITAGMGISSGARTRIVKDDTVDCGTIEPIFVKDKRIYPADEPIFRLLSRDDAGGGASSSGSCGGGGGSDGGSSSSSASNAEKLLKNPDLKDEEWEKLEEMLKKILGDCVGGNLYNGLVKKMGGKTFNIKFAPNSKVSSFDLKNGFTLNSSESSIFFHELFHAY